MESTPGSGPHGSGPARDGDQWITPVSANADSEGRLRSLLERSGAGIRVRVDAPGDLDVVGHALGGAGELTLTILDDEDDTEGHAISLHFPSLEEAKRFQNRMLATGAIVGTLVIAGTGLALTQALPDAGTAGGAQAQVQSAVPGFASVDNMGGTPSAVDAAVPGFASVNNMGGTPSAADATAGSQAWADQGFGADVSNAVAAPTTGGQAAADEGYGAQAPTPGSQAWADQGGADVSNAIADPTVGGQAAADPSYGGSDDADDAGSGNTHRGPQPR